MVVVLPAAFGTTKAKMSPDEKQKLMSLTAWVLPKCRLEIDDAERQVVAAPRRCRRRSLPVSSKGQPSKARPG